MKKYRAIELVKERIIGENIRTRVFPYRGTEEFKAMMWYYQT